MSHKLKSPLKVLTPPSLAENHSKHSNRHRSTMSHAINEHASRRKRPLRVLVDMDGVLCDFEGSFLDKFRERYPDEPYIPLSEREGFYIDEQYSKIKQNLQEKTLKIIDSEGFFRELKPVDGAVAAMHAMSSMDGVDVFLCTSPLTRSYHSVKEKFEWVEHHLGWNWISKMIITKDKTIISGDILIDDRPNIKGIEAQPTWDHILFTACHNGKLDISHLYCKQRLNNWTDGAWIELIEHYKQKL